ncbi:hypothetical protein [Ilumatobacter sp.]|uniref:hypothetical protein n=1 Tax=Ilumatobacter sp. TaxID=1967498 RepID=UPI003753A7A9
MNTEIAWVDLESSVPDTRRRAPRRGGLVAYAAATAVLVALVALWAFSESDTDSTPVDDPSGDFVVDAINSLPAGIAVYADIGNDLRIAGVDLDALARLAGVERPAKFVAAGPWAEVVGRQEAGTVQRSDLFQRGLADADAFIAELSFSPLDVTSYTTVAVENHAGALDVFTLISGADGVGAAVGDDNFLQIGAGEPGEINVADRTSLRPLGRPIMVEFDPVAETVAVDSGLGFLSADLNRSAESRLTSSPDLAAVAEQLDRMPGLIGFQLTQSDFSIGTVLQQDGQGVERVNLIDRPFSSLGIGRSGSGPSARTTYVYLFNDEADAAAARPSVDALFGPNNVVPTPRGGTEQVMGNFVTVVSIETAGRTVVVTTAVPDDPTEPVRVLFLPAFFHR